MKSPVVLTLFNRHADTLHVFETIREARPSTLFLISDAGRTPEEHAQCVSLREVIEAAVDWPCTVLKNYADTNMGPKLRLSSGITWVFKNTDRAIILEHDCVPTQDFYKFCDELLERYKDDERVMHISGESFQDMNPDFSISTSYYFSTVPHIWGWATWARAWKTYDVDMKLWPQTEKENLLAHTFPDPAVRDRWEYRFRQYYAGEINSWDGQWSFACFRNNGLSINPVVNLVANIGFGPEAFGTKDPTSVFANRKTLPLSFPLVHPILVEPNRMADAYTAREVFGINKHVSQKIRWWCKTHLPRAYKFLKKIHNRYLIS